jgi:thioesterase domain-containing protein
MTGAATYGGAKSKAAAQALFARVPRTPERIFVPLTDLALDKHHAAPGFYCVHALSGAGGLDFVDLARRMPSARVFGIQAPPNRMQDSAFGCSVEAIAAFYADALMQYQPAGPLLLGGWSAGAVIALEMAQRLTAQHGRDVRLLVAMDGAPEGQSGILPPWHPLYLVELAANVPRWIAHEGLFRRGQTRAAMRQIAVKGVAKARAIAARITGRGAGRLHAVDGFMDLSPYTPMQRAFMRRLYDALLRYRPLPYAGNVVVYESTVGPLHYLPQVGRVWRRVAAATERVRIAGTTHMNIVRAPYVDALADDLRPRIAQAVAG